MSGYGGDRRHNPTDSRCHRAPASRRVAASRRRFYSARGNSAAATSPPRIKWIDRWTNRRSLSPFGHCARWRAILTAKIQGAWRCTVQYSQHASIQRTIKEKAHSPLHLLRLAVPYVRACVRACIRMFVHSCLRRELSFSPHSLPYRGFLSSSLLVCVSITTTKYPDRDAVFSSSFFFSYPPSSGNSIGRQSPPFLRKRALPPAIAAPSIAAVPRRGSTLEFGSDYSDFSVYSTRRNGGRVRTCGISST